MFAFSAFNIPLVDAEDVAPTPSPVVTVVPETTPVPESMPAISPDISSEPTPEVSPSVEVSPEATPAPQATLIEEPVPSVFPTVEASPAATATGDPSPTISPEISPDVFTEPAAEPSPSTVSSPSVETSPASSESPEPSATVSPDAIDQLETSPTSEVLTPPIPLAEPMLSDGEAAQASSFIAEPLQQISAQSDEPIDENTCTFSRTVQVPAPDFFSHKNGQWTDPEVWGFEPGTGTYPTPGSIVRVDHNVGLEIRGVQTNDIGGLIVGSNGRIYNSYFSQSLNVNGAVWNEGIIKVPDGDIYGLSLSVSGDIYNAGTWDISGLHLYGNEPRTITPVQPMQHNTAQVTINDDMTLEGCFTLNDIVQLGNHTLTIPEGSRISLNHIKGVGGHLTGGGTLRLTRGTHVDADFTGDIRYLVFDQEGGMSLYGSYEAQEIILTGGGTFEILMPVSFTGTTRIRSGVTVKSGSSPSSPHSLTVNGDLHNEGFFTDYGFNGIHFALDVNGDLFPLASWGAVVGRDIFLPISMAMSSLLAKVAIRECVPMPPFLLIRLPQIIG